MASDTLHESPDQLEPETLELHRAITSLIEELEAVDWYAQRVDATQDAELAAILAHNRDEEKEHACMTLEWIRRRDPQLDAHLRRFLFRDGPIGSQEHAPDDDGADSSGEPSLAVGGLRPEPANETEAER